MNFNSNCVFVSVIIYFILFDRKVLDFGILSIKYRGLFWSYDHNIFVYNCSYVGDENYTDKCLYIFSTCISVPIYKDFGYVWAPSFIKISTLTVFDVFLYYRDVILNFARFPF